MIEVGVRVGLTTGASEDFFETQIGNQFVRRTFNAQRWRSLNHDPISDWCGPQSFDPKDRGPTIDAV
jgi:hypothetical protein